MLMSNIIVIAEREWLSKKDQERWTLAHEGIPALMTDPAADLLTTATLHAREPDAFHMTWDGLT